MIHLKTKEELEIMKQGGDILKSVVSQVIPNIKPGIKTEDIDNEAERLIKKQGALPSFKEVEGYYWTTCLPINEQIVHTPPSKRILKEGDVLSIDIGVYYKGYHTDWATTLIVGQKKDEKHKKFLEVGKSTLKKAIEKAKIGRHLGEISALIQKEIEGNGYFVVKELTGHGIGCKLHEEPYIPGFLDKSVKQTPIMKSGLTMAIEVIYSEGTEEMIYEPGENWSIVTKDGSISACFESTVALSDKKTFILT
ncbi:MAG: type I methionyl aminopeptidase [Candidatus Roizmanbacteria bacterium]|nr:MAG: type I methionyl aminopeptidase [Candidatus Roizmanbacteria bacterium]